jgi:hypothetical protein
MDYARVLSPIKLHIDSLLLDPNNPRFSELGAGFAEIDESRFSEAQVQQAAYDKMRSQTFDVAELRDTIKTLGFLPMDRLVVRRWRGDGDDKFVVVEGNRRLTALKWLLQLHNEGKETLSPDQLSQFTEFEGLVLAPDVPVEQASIVLPGLRHVSGIKEWGPYQKAKTVAALRDSGATPQEAAQSLGLSTRAANTAYRCFRALEAFKADEEFGENVKPEMYSYFEELFKRPTVKSWLGWDDAAETFTAADRLKEFYSWIVPSQDEEDAAQKLPTALSVRELSKIVDDDSAMAVFRAHDGSLESALAQFAVEHPTDWVPRVTAALMSLKSLTPAKLRGMDEAALGTLEELRSQIDQTIADRTTLLSS